MKILAITFHKFACFSIFRFRFLFSLIILLTILILPRYYNVIMHQSGFEGMMEALNVFQGFLFFLANRVPAILDFSISEY